MALALAKAAGSAGVLLLATAALSRSPVSFGTLRTLGSLWGLRSLRGLGTLFAAPAFVAIIATPSTHVAQVDKADPLADLRFWQLGGRRFGRVYRR